MFKKLFIIQLIWLSIHCYSQKSKIDSIIVTTINCTYDSLENKLFNSAERELETCSVGLWQYKKWNYVYFPDTSIVFYRYDFTSANSKEKFNIYWDHSDPHFQEMSFYFEKYYDETKTFKSIELIREKTVSQNVRKKDTLMARNVQTRQEHGNMPDPFYLHHSNLDTTIDRISIWLKVIDVNGEQSLKKSYIIAPAILPEIVDSIDGQTNYNVVIIRSFFERIAVAMENMELQNERKINLDSTVFVEKFRALPQVLYNFADKKRPSYIDNRNKHFQRTKKEKNCEIWEFSDSDDCSTIKYEIY